MRIREIPLDEDGVHNLLVSWSYLEPWASSAKSVEKVHMGVCRCERLEAEAANGAVCGCEWCAGVGTGLCLRKLSSRVTPPLRFAPHS